MPDDSTRDQARRDEDFDVILRSGSAAVAETIRPWPPEAVRARGDWRRRRKAAGTTLLAAAILAGGGGAYAAISRTAPSRAVAPAENQGQHPRPAHGSGLTPHRGHSGGSPVRLLPAGRVGSRAQVPWSRVGAGWTLAEVSAGQDQDGEWLGSGPLSLSLLDPAGGRYVIAARDAAAGWTLLAWSGDGARALLGVNIPDTLSYSQYQVLTLATGAIATFAAPADATPTGFTRPDGTSVLAVQRAGHQLRLQRYSLAGELQATLASHAAGSAAGQAISSPDGTTVAWADGRGLQLVSNAGGVLRNLPVPGTSPAPGCTPLRWWDARTLLARCSVDAGGQQLWLVPANGAAPTALAPPVATASDYNIATGAWPLAGTVYVTQSAGSTCPGAAGGPGGSVITAVGSGSALVPVNVAGSQGSDNAVQGKDDGRLLVVARTSCPGTSSLLWLTPASGATQSLLAPPDGQFGVVAAQLFGAGGG